MVQIYNEALKLSQRIALLSQLGTHFLENGSELQNAKEKANRMNAWFEPAFTDLAIHSIATEFLDLQKLEQWVEAYEVPETQASPKTVGITMAGNIPLVGFHDWLTIFAAGHKQRIKPSSKDEVLIQYIIDTLTQWEPAIANYMKTDSALPGCDAYIATGSNNSARYFEYYFARFPHIIRKNRTSMAILSGEETPEMLEALADDILLYFGLGCRNVSKLMVPEGYQFESLLKALLKYEWMKDHHKFRNNFDYNLSLHLLNNKYFMTNDVVLLIENEPLFSPIAQVNYEFYPKDTASAIALPDKDSLQCLCGTKETPFGKAQQPSLTDYADGVDTMQFACSL